MKWSTINNQYVSFRLSLRRGVTPHFLSPPLITPPRWFTAGATESNYMVVKILCLFSHYFRIKNLSVMGRQTHHSKDIIWEMMKYSLDSDTTTHFSPHTSGPARFTNIMRANDIFLDYFIRFNNIIRWSRTADLWSIPGGCCCGCLLIKASLLRCEHSALISCSHAGYRGRGSGVVSSVSPSQPFNFNVSMQHSPLTLTQSRWEERSALLT